MLFLSISIKFKYLSSHLKFNSLYRAIYLFAILLKTFVNSANSKHDTESKIYVKVYLV